MRETILKCVRWCENTDRGDYAQFERLRNQADEKTKSYNIDHAS